MSRGEKQNAQQNFINIEETKKKKNLFIYDTQNLTRNAKQQSDANLLNIKN